MFAENFNKYTAYTTWSSLLNTVTTAIVKI